ncbi:hypothetical protein [Ruminobacter amylophilus]|uniref:pilus assembly PilX family protein n=1 Tax=Ruminobacter amylophilus TaxID=867 RepID=UPI00386F4235
MFIRNQRGVALVVALMITVIIGIIAVTLAGVTSKSQKSDNSYYGRALGSNSAISGVNRAINFLSATSNVKDFSKRADMFKKEGTPSVSQWTIDGSLVNTADFFRGIKRLRNNNEVNSQDKPWYRKASEWDASLCPKNNCVVLNNGTTIYYIEQREIRPCDASGSECNFNYEYYRITSRGLDRVGNNRSAAIVQTHVRVRVPKVD